MPQDSMWQRILKSFWFLGLTKKRPKKYLRAGSRVMCRVSLLVRWVGVWGRDEEYEVAPRDGYHRSGALHVTWGRTRGACGGRPLRPRAVLCSAAGGLVFASFAATPPLDQFPASRFFISISRHVTVKWSFVMDGRRWWCLDNHLFHRAFVHACMHVSSYTTCAKIFCFLQKKK